MALPLSRNTTYVGGVSQVKSADLNDLQDQIIALSAGTDFVSAIEGQPGHSGDTAWAAASSGGDVVGASAGLDWIMGVKTRAGTKITLTAFLSTSASGGFVNLLYVDPTAGGSPTLVESVAIGGTGYQSIPFAQHAVVSGMIYSLQFNPTTGAGTKHVVGYQNAWTR